MSNGFRITVAVISALGACGFFLFGVPALVGGFLKEGLGFSALGVFFLSVTLACLWEASRPVTVRIIGGGLFLAGVWSTVDGLERIQAGEIVPLRNLIGIALVFGLPGLFLLITAGYPKWGAHSGLFYQNDNSE